MHFHPDSMWMSQKVFNRLNQVDIAFSSANLDNARTRPQIAQPRLIVRHQLKPPHQRGTDEVVGAAAGREQARQHPKRDMCPRYSNRLQKVQARLIIVAGTRRATISAPACGGDKAVAGRDSSSAPQRPRVALAAAHRNGRSKCWARGGGDGMKDSDP